MNRNQQTALQHHCRLGAECTHPRFVYKRGAYSIVLTVDSGYA
jgi:hypothetical protein